MRELCFKTTILRWKSLPDLLGKEVTPLLSPMMAIALSNRIGAHHPQQDLTAVPFIAFNSKSVAREKLFTTMWGFIISSYLSQTQNLNLEYSSCKVISNIFWLKQLKCVMWPVILVNCTNNYYWDHYRKFNI